MDSSLTPFNARSMQEQIDQIMYPIRASIWTYGCIGLCGLILASVGLAGMTAYSVAQRGREIGVRMALGAQSADVLGLVMKEGAALVAVGTIIALPAPGPAIACYPRFYPRWPRLRARPPPTRCCCWALRCCWPAWRWLRVTCRREGPYISTGGRVASGIGIKDTIHEG
jgi:hypothetical protein